MGNRIAKHIYSDGGVYEKSTYYVRDASGNVMANYEFVLGESLAGSSLKITERPMYGSSRLGMDVTTFEFIGAVAFEVADTTSRRLGHKQYEISNHLGNVLSVVSDVKLAVTLTDENDLVSIIGYNAVVISVTDYSPFGVALYGRKWSSESYRYGFNGKEKDDELCGSYGFEFRIYSPHLGKFMSVDPLTHQYPFYTPYQFAGNKVIECIDLEGLEDLHYTLAWDENGENPKLALDRVEDDLIDGFMYSIYINGVYIGDRITEDGAKEYAAHWGQFSQDQFNYAVDAARKDRAEFQEKMKARSEEYGNAILGARAATTPKGTYIKTNTAESKTTPAPATSSPKEVNQKTGTAAPTPKQPTANTQTQTSPQNNSTNKITGGALRNSLYSALWQKASLKQAVAKFAPNSTPVNTDTGKILYTNAETGVQVVYDPNGKYFRIENTNHTGPRAYTNINGEIQNNVIENGSSRGMSQSEYNASTHFLNID
jgi:RHS repeat-associated protein